MFSSPLIKVVILAKTVRSFPVIIELLTFVSHLFLTHTHFCLLCKVTLNLKFVIKNDALSSNNSNMPKKLICCSYCTVPQQGQASRRRALLVSQRHAAHAKLMHSQKSKQQQTLALVANQVFLALKKELYIYPQEINSPKWLLCNTSLQHKVQTRNLHQPHPLEMLMIPD